MMMVSRMKAKIFYVRNKIIAVTAVSALCVGMLAGCGNNGQKQNDDLQSVASAPVEEMSSAIQEEPLEETIDYSPYDELIAEATEILSNGRDEDTVAPERMSSVFVMQGDYETLGYLRQDLDGNGVEELIFGGNSDMEGFNGVIYDIYSIDNGELVHVLDGWERNRFYLCTNGCIANEASGGAFLSAYQYYTYADGKISIKETVEYNAEYDPDNPWFYTTKEINELTEDDNANIKSLTEEEASEIMDSYEYVELQYTSFVEKAETAQEDVESEINEDEPIYYWGQLLGKKDDFLDSEKLGDVVSVEKDGNTLKIYASFNRSNESFEEDAEYLEYDDYIFTLGDDISYYGTGGEDPEPFVYSEEEFFEICESYNGLGLRLKVENGVVTEAYVES